MIPDKTPRVLALEQRLETFMATYVYPNEVRFCREMEDLGPWRVAPVVEELKAKARAAGLWNLFLPDSEYGAGLKNTEYAPLCEIMGRSHLLAPEVFNCSAPDTGNMEVLVRYGTPEQQQRWLLPLLAGEIRSAFAMTEPEVASSDARNIQSSIKRIGNKYVINGHKWYTAGATDPRCGLFIFMGKSNPDADAYHQQSMILIPRDTAGITVKRALPVFGFYGIVDRPAEVLFHNVQVPVANILLGEGRGFEIAQGRLGPGRVHHCMRLIGLAERALSKMCLRTTQRVTFGKPLSERSLIRQRVAEARIMIERSRLLTLHAAHMMDTIGNKDARAEIAMIKIDVPKMAQQVLDWAIQAFGGGGTNNDFGLTAAWSTARLLRLADGPDEVHCDQLARLEYRRQAAHADRLEISNWPAALNNRALGEGPFTPQAG